MTALRKIGYAGTFNFEADAVFDDFENKLANSAVKEKASELLYAVGCAMLEL